jgi:hypothetical protein
MKSASPFVLLFIILLSCNNLKEGKVINKWYEKERRYTTMQMVGKIPVTRWHTDDEDYMVEIAKEINGRMVTKDVELIKGDWDSIEVGRYIYLR